MEFKIHKRENEDLGKYDTEAMHLARRFAKKLYAEFGTFLKAVVLFGSSARQKSDNDVDVLVVVDDVTLVMGAEVAETYRIIIEKIIASISKRLHITTLKLTSFWEYVRAGDPIGINILRDGIALMDTGLFDPLKLLLMEGRIRPTSESVWNYFMKAPNSLHNSQWHILKAVGDLYWAVTDSAHSALMSVGEVPPSPQHIPDLLNKKLVEKKLITTEYPKIAKEFYDIMKKIDHREIQSISGADYDKYYKKAVKFVNAMQKIVDKYKLGE